MRRSVNLLNLGYLLRKFQLSVILWGMKTNYDIVVDGVLELIDWSCS